MFAVIRQYHLNPIFEDVFLSHWHSMVEDYRLSNMLVTASIHKESPISFIVYERWIDKNGFTQITNDDKMHLHVEKLQEICNDIHLLHTMDVLQDTVA